MTASKPKISIVTINYNNANGLRDTIESVLAQSYEAIEHVVIDGASTDGSQAVLEEFRPRLGYALSEPDTGIYNAMNKGVRAASGDYLLFINSGDILIDADVIAKCVELGFDKELIIGDLLFINGEETKVWKPAHLLTFDLFCSMGIPHPTTFIQREVFDKVGLYDEHYKIVSDWKFFMLAVCKHDCTYKRIDIVVSGFMEGGISTLESNRPLMLEEREKAIAESFSAFLPDYEELWASRKQLRKLRYTIKIKKFLGIR